MSDRPPRSSSSPVGGVPSPRKPNDPADENPGVPGFQSWPGVYWFVFGCFVASVVALTVFSRTYA